ARVSPALGGGGGLAAALLAGAAAEDGGGFLARHVALGGGLVVVLLDEEPAVAALHVDEGVAAAELLPVEPHLGLPLVEGLLHRAALVLAEVPVGPPVPHDDGAGAVPRGDDALEAGVGEGVVLRRRGEPLLCGVGGGPLPHGPRLQNAADLEAEVVVEGAGVVLLYDEGRGRVLGVGRRVGGRLGGRLEVALLTVRREGVLLLRHGRRS